MLVHMVVAYISEWHNVVFAVLTVCLHNCKLDSRKPDSCTPAPLPHPAVLPCVRLRKIYQYFLWKEAVTVVQGDASDISPS
jgi:hypothetical protein